MKVQNLRKLLTVSLACCFSIVTLAEHSPVTPLCVHNESEERSNQSPGSNIIQASGRVIDENGDPVIGASVIQKGTGNGVVTDIDGHYTLKVPSGSTLEISYVGFQKSVIIAGVGKNTIMHEDSKDLNEVVVVGYGTMRKSDLTGSISQTKGDDILKGQSFSA
ncbi:MAG: carboxypeptidase-like regulatory domain-containing protein, partial [Prevotella sp.]|nr:carboxypeptidase-like regulatory domain-containing protein [Prevotella sp.]